MKNSLLTSLKLLGLSAVFSTLALAAPVTGSIGFTGPYVANDGDLTVATSISFANSGVNQIVTDGNHTGSFAGIATGTAVTMFTPLVVNQPGVVLPGGPIWSVGGFSLTLTSIWEVYNDSSSLLLKGMGVLSDGNAADDSIGEWIGTFNKSGTNFTFSASSSSIPDGGTTAVLLGLGLVGLSVIARRKIA